MDYIDGIENGFNDLFKHESVFYAGINLHIDMEYLHSGIVQVEQPNHPVRMISGEER
jgi:hypothetical protein